MQLKKVIKVCWQCPNCGIDIDIPTDKPTPTPKIEPVTDQQEGTITRFGGHATSRSRNHEPKNALKHWSKKDEARLKEMYNRRVPINSMVQELGRSEFAIYTRLSYLRIAQQKRKPVFMHDQEFNAISGAIKEVLTNEWQTGSKVIDLVVDKGHDRRKTNKVLTRMTKHRMLECWKRTHKEVQEYMPELYKTVGRCCAKAICLYKKI